MLSFNDLTEKKSTKVKINPRLEDIKEGDKKKCSKCDGKGCEHCDDTGYHTESCGTSHSKKKKKPMSEAKKKDDTYLETDFKKRQANNEKARKDLMKGPKMKNPHFESTEEIYDSQEEVSEESNQSIAETETLLTFGQFSEGMTMKDFKANRRKLKRKEASADAKKRGHVGKEWYNSGRTYSPDEAKSGRAKMQDHERQTRHRSAVDPDSENDDLYSADKTKNPKKLRKQKAMGEAITVMDFDDFIVALEEGRAEDAQASLAKVKARQKVLDAHEKKTGTKLDISKSPEHKAHKQNFPGAKRQEKKVKGAKETDLQTHNRRVQTYMDRLKKHGKTTKQKRDDEAMAKHTSRYD